MFLEGRFFKQDPTTCNNRERGFIFRKSTQHKQDGEDFSPAEIIEDFLEGSSCTPFHEEKTP